MKKDMPIITGLSATYLYRSAREIGETNEYNSIAGEPSGHFAVLSGYDKGMKNLLVSDPFHLNPFAGSHYYWVDIQRVISAILLGIVSYDANLLILEPDHASLLRSAEKRKERAKNPGFDRRAAATPPEKSVKESKRDRRKKMKRPT